ncbi:MAG TPA: sigma-70 family RNA polymerase sigma factor [Tenuifilaceae bacterium]|jgi:RNA polymerase sigma-70 factor (ECF subfamily)|nr:sigma-70 family RNA polymerase sigma factor [Tenuifilaceae bacterium]
MKIKGSYYQNIHQALIDDCKRGSSEAQFEIYKLYYKSMYNTSLRIVANEAEAEDIMQEAFFKAFDKISSYRNEVSFGAWLKRIVVNASIDSLKKKRAMLVPLDEAHGIGSTDETNDIEPESVEQLKAALEKLPEGYKLVLNLNYIEGYSHEEIASMLGITASTSRSQLTRAKQKLIDVMKTLKSKR